MASAPFIASFLLLATAHSMTVWPKPALIQTNDARYRINASALTFLTDTKNPLLLDSISRYHAMLTKRNVSLPYYGGANEGVITSVTVSVNDDSVSVKTLETDESYTLAVEAPSILVVAPNVYGAMYAFETLSQLVDNDLHVNGTIVEDHPRFAYRSVMIDTARHWYPMESIKMNIDAMSYAKMNVMHWHLVDTISFPFNSSSFPALTKEGAFSPEEIYTHADIKEIIQYANNRGIRVVPEFDTPGHVLEGWRALGVLTDCYDQYGRNMGPNGCVLDVTKDRTYDVLTAFYAEVKEVFSPETFVHVGGDEVAPDCWASNPDIKFWMAQHPEVDGFAGLETYFEQKLLNMLKAQGSSYIVWQEIYDNGAKVLPDTVIGIWKGGLTGWTDEAANVTAAGFHSVLSAPFYLDHISYGNDWVGYYLVEPSNFTGGEDAERNGLMGGIEACVWSEYIDSTNFIPRTWPRAAAVAERAWSPKQVRDMTDATDRLHEFRCKLVSRGINAEPIGNCGTECAGVGGFCPKEWSPQYQPVWEPWRK